MNLPKSSIIDEIADHRDKLLNENRKLNERIKRLEEALDTLTLVVGLTPIRGNLAALQEAMDESRAVLKAKEAKL